MEPAELRERVERDIRERDLIPPGGEVVCLVSGGPDSSTLLLFLAALARSRRLHLTAAYFDHRLRGPEASLKEANTKMEKNKILSTVDGTV